MSQMAAANTTSSNTHEDDSLEGMFRVDVGILSLIRIFEDGSFSIYQWPFFLIVGNDRLHERLQDDTGLRRRHGENVETSYEFVKSSDHNISNSSSTPNTNSTDSSIYHQKISLSNDAR